jgi:hypothetical protein
MESAVNPKIVVPFGECLQNGGFRDEIHSDVGYPFNAGLSKTIISETAQSLVSLAQLLMRLA